MRQRRVDAQLATGTAEPVGERLAWRRLTVPPGPVGVLPVLLRLPLPLPRGRRPLLVGQASLPAALPGPDAGADVLVKVQPVCALVARPDAVQARVEDVALGLVRRRVDAVLPRAVPVSWLGTLQLGLPPALVPRVLHVVARVLLLAGLVRVKDKPVGAQLAPDLPVAAAEVPVALVGVLEQPVRLRAVKLDLRMRC